MNVALCTRNAGNPVIQLLKRYLVERGHTASVLTDPRQILGTSPRSFDVGFWRPDSRNEQVAAFARQVPEILEASGVPFLNSLASGDRATNKLVTYAVFSGAGVVTPATWVPPQKWDEPSAIRIPEGPKIVKPVGGKASRGVRHFESREEALEYADTCDEPCLLQTPVRWTRQFRIIGTPSRCVRAFDQPNPALAPTAAIARFDTSSAQYLADPSAAVTSLASEMVRLVGGNLMRADILLEADGTLWALEVNSSFGFPHGDMAVLEAFEAELTDLLAGRVY